ncbi:MAG: Glycosyltransferase [Parcubacteria group bacterium GW2011_GWC2_45_7]|nr:MAG: Glycosyltransferase [Parcubacteria group bacterium GW2011_GWC2_45_7]
MGLYTFNLLRAIFSLDKENEYHIFYNARRRLNAPEFKEYGNVAVHHFQWPNRFLNLSLRFLRRPKIDKLIFDEKRCDLFFMPNLNFAALSLDTKLVTVVHDLSFEHFPECFSYKTRLWHRLINPRALLYRADHIIAISEHTRDDLNETYQVSASKMTVVYPGLTIDPGDNAYGDDGAVSASLRMIGSNYILYFGALDARKNLESLVEAYELYATDVGNKGSLPNLVLAGARGSATLRLKKQIAKSKLRDKIFLLENPSEEEKHYLYLRAALFVYPSFYEGFGFPPLEAYAHSVPAIVSSASSMPEVCGGAAFLVNPWNIVEIKEGMRIMLNDTALRKKYIEAGKKRLEQFSWQKCAQEVLQVFKKL